MNLSIKPSLERNITLGFFAVLLALLLVGAAAWINAARADATFRTVSRSYEVLLQLEATLTHTLNMQTGTRGYVLTGDERFLVHRTEGEANAQRALERLRTLTADDPRLQQPLTEIATLMAEAVASMDERIAARRARGIVTANDTAAVVAGKADLDRIRSVITAAQEEERRFLQSRSTEARDASRVTRWIVAAGGVLAVFCVGIAALFVGRDLRERRQVAATLEKSRATFMQLFEGAADGFVVVNREGRIVRANKQAEALFGWPRGELAGHSLEILLPERLRSRHAGHLAAYFAAPRQRAMGVGLELFGVRQDGSEFPIDIMLSPLESEETPQVLAVIRDITARKQGEDALRKSQQMFQRLFENAPDAIVLVDRDSHIVRANAQAEALFGWSRDELIDRPVDLLMPPRFRERHGAHLAAYFGSPRPRAMGAGLELFGIRKDGGEFAIDIMLSPLETEDGMHALAVIRDITARKLHEDALRKSQHMFQRLFENAPDAIILVDRHGRIVRANAPTEALFGWPPVELATLTLDALLPERFRSRHGAHLAAYFAAPRARAMGAGLELFALRKDSSEFPVDIMLSPFETEEGTQVLAVVRDITARKAAEEKINQLNAGLRLQNAQLQAANAELESFSYSVSHDLRAPLRHIDGFAGLLQNHAAGVLDEKSRRFIATISGAAKQMGKLIDALLAFSRMGRTPIAFVPVDQNQLIADILRNGSLPASARLVDWHISPLPTVHADLPTLRQVWTNLLDNAVKYTSRSPQPRVEVGSYADEKTGERVFYVRDNGAGFDMQYVGKLFGVFQRLHDSAEFDGIGVGLANVRRIITRHGGRTWAEGAPGQGATFYFSLPSAPSELRN